MKYLLGALFIFILFIVFLVALSAGLDGQVRATNAQANLEYTRASNEAMLMRTSAQASQQNAIAFSMTMMTLMPWGVLFTVSLLGLAVIGLVFTLAYFRHSERQHPMIVYLPNPELPRREVWNALANSRDVIQIEQPTSVLHKLP